MISGPCGNLPCAQPASAGGRLRCPDPASRFSAVFVCNGSSCRQGDPLESDHDQPGDARVVPGRDPARHPRSRPLSSTPVAPSARWRTDTGFRKIRHAGCGTAGRARYVPIAAGGLNGDTPVTSIYMISGENPTSATHAGEGNRTPELLRETLLRRSPLAAWLPPPGSWFGSLQ